MSKETIELYEQAKQIAIEFIGKDKIKEINSNGISENTNMPCYDFSIVLNDEQDEENKAKRREAIQKALSNLKSPE